MINSIAIKQRMQELRITQDSLAQAVGIATPTLNQKLNNVRSMDLDEMFEIQKVLRIDDADLRYYFFA